MSGAKNRLIARKMAVDAVPPGGGFDDGLNFLLDKGKVADTASKAKEWVEQAIHAVRNAQEPNPWKDASDEEIAEEILRRAEAQDTRQGGQG